LKIAKLIASDYLPRILNSQVYDAAIETPLIFAPNISSLVQNHCYLKREDMQPVFSFKIRGAYNKIANLSKDKRDMGVVTCSAGNHAQGVAFSAAKLGINAIIVMPLATPSIKVDAVRKFGGATVIVKLHGNNFDEAAAEAKRMSKENGYELIHPFDDPDVIAGQGTIGAEIMKVTLFSTLLQVSQYSNNRDSVDVLLIEFLLASGVGDCLLV
jgi:threonine dehydratase